MSSPLEACATVQKSLRGAHLSEQRRQNLFFADFKELAEDTEKSARDNHLHILLLLLSKGLFIHYLLPLLHIDLDSHAPEMQAPPDVAWFKLASTSYFSLKPAPAALLFNASKGHS